MENRPGAGGTLGAEIGAKAPPDGYTLTVIAGSYSVNPSLFKLAFDPVNDITPIIQLSQGPLLIVCHPGLPVKTAKDLIALAKAKPDRLNYATSGIGSPGHLAAVLLESMAGVKLVHIPYKGGGPAITDLLAGHVPVFFAVISTAVPHVQTGKARGIAVTGTRRADAMPDIPTIAEAGVPGYAATNWYGLLAPAKTPKPAIDRLNREMAAALKAPEVAEGLKSRGIDAAPSSPAEFAAFIRAENTKWSKVIKQSGIGGEAN